MFALGVGMKHIAIVGTLVSVGLVSPQARALSTFSCEVSKETGYVQGSSFEIKVVSVDGKLVERNTANAYYFMAKAAAKDGVQISVVSGFRTMAQQQYLYNCYVNCACNSCNLAAVPGYSNHQSGSALDVNTSSPGVYAWLDQHASAFGFVRTVPSEAWHWEYKGKLPVGGPCGTLKAELRDAWSDAQPDQSGDADYIACSGEQFRMWFELKNIGTARWADLGGDGWYVGERMKLEPVGGETDLLTGLERVRLTKNANDNVRPKAWGGTPGEACNNKPKCRRTVFTDEGLLATAPDEPGIYTSKWQLRDRTPVTNKSFGPKMKLTFRVESCATPHEPDPEPEQPRPDDATQNDRFGSNHESDLAGPHGGDSSCTAHPATPPRRPPGLVGHARARRGAWADDAERWRYDRACDPLGVGRSGCRTRARFRGRDLRVGRLQRRSVHLRAGRARRLSAGHGLLERRRLP